MACSKVNYEVERGSDVDKEIPAWCATCKSDGLTNAAVKFCLDCKVPVCQLCVDSHRRIPQIKSHKLVDDITKDTLKLAAWLTTAIQCPKHWDKTIELECKNHDVMCCLTCATVDHRNCQQAVEIACQARNTNMDSVTQNLMNDLASAQTQMRHIAQQHETGDKEIQSQADDAIPKKLKYLRKCIDDKLNEMERQICGMHNFKVKKNL